MKRVLKWNIPVDDVDHPVGSGPVIHVGSQGGGRYDLVTVWTVEDQEPDDVGNIRVTSARVYGTGHPVPEGDEPLGSVVVANGALVWHVFRAVPS